MESLNLNLTLIHQSKLLHYRQVLLFCFYWICLMFISFSFWIIECLDHCPSAHWEPCGHGQQQQDRAPSKHKSPSRQCHLGINDLSDDDDASNGKPKSKVSVHYKENSDSNWIFEILLTNIPVLHGDKLWVELPLPRYVGNLNVGHSALWV